MNNKQAQFTLNLFDLDNNLGTVYKKKKRLFGRSYCTPFDHISICAQLDLDQSN